MFDEPNLVSAAGLVPIMELAEQTGLSWLIGKHVDLPSTRVKSGAVNPVGKLTTIIGGMICGADSIDEVDAPSTLGIFLREFTFGHANQLAAVAREHLAVLAARTALLPGIEQRAFLDIDSLLRPVYGHLKQGASFGHAKIASRALLRLGLSPQITTLSTGRAAPVIAEARLRSGKAGSGRAAAWQVKQAIGTARECGAIGTIMLRGDSAFGTKTVMTTCVEEGVQFSLPVARNKRISTAIGGIDEDSYTSVHYPGAVEDPDTGELISNAEVAETRYPLRLGRVRTLTVRLVMRRGHARRRRCRRCPRRHLAPRPDQRARSLRRPSPQTDAAPASPLAPANRMENPVGQRHRPLLPDRPTTRRLTHRPVPVHPAARPDRGTPKESWYRPADQACATVPIPGRRSGKPRQRPHEITHPLIQAKSRRRSCSSASGAASQMWSHTVAAESRVSLSWA